MKIAAVAPCLYPDTKRIHYLEESCARQGVELFPMGIGRTFANWRNMTLQTMVPGCRELLEKGYTHILYMDGADTIMVGGMEEIEAKYQKMGRPPCLFSSERNCYPQGFMFPERGWGRFPNCGACLADIDYWTTGMMALASMYPEDGNPQSWVMNGWDMNAYSIDNYCEIFQTMDGCPSVRVSKNSVHNRATNTFPSVLHFPGGYVDPVHGRDERMKPVWEELYGS